MNPVTDFADIYRTAHAVKGYLYIDSFNEFDT